jgi:hypothetical protein
MTQDIKIARADADYSDLGLAQRAVRWYRALSGVLMTAILFLGLVALVMHASDKEAKVSCLELQSMFADVRSAGAEPVASIQEAIRCAELGIRI